MLAITDINERIKAALAAPVPSHLTVAQEPQITWYPFYDIKTRSTELAAAAYMVIQDHSDNSVHTVVVGYTRRDSPENVGIWCSDKFLEGNLDETNRNQRIKEALSGVPAKKKKQLEKELEAAFSCIERPSDKCTFWTTWRARKELCAHTEAGLAHMAKQFGDDFVTTELKTKYDQLFAGDVQVGTDKTFNLAELAFRVPVLIEGDRGAGKTVEVRKFARENGFKTIEVGGHESCEAADLLGYLVPYGQGTSMVWKDGPISQAFRSAKAGQKTVLIIDELLRIPQRELSILLTALSPDEGVYRLRTGRIIDVVDGIAEEESLECPMENLCVLATTNVGAEYAVDEIDPALAERFMPMRKDTTRESLKKILNDLIEAKGIETPVLDMCLTFYTKMTEARNRGLVSRAPTTRTMVRALELSESKEDVVRALRSMTLLWITRDASGQPVEEQAEVVTKILDKSFKLE